MRLTRALIALPLLLPLGAGCATSKAAAPPSTPLYERLGGKGAISAVVHDFVGRLGADTRINARFANADLPKLERLLVEQICQATGGPCQYTGRDMKSSHVGMYITDDDFGALVADLKASLDHFKVPDREQNELLGALAAMKGDIVEGPRPTAAAGKPGEPSNPLAERALALREAAGLLEKASAAYARGNRSLAEQLFSAAEVLVPSDPLMSLAATLREGAPPRISTPTLAYPKDAAPQPATVGSSDDEEPEAKPLRSSLAGTVRIEGAGAFDGLAVVTLEPTTGRTRKRQPRQRVIEQRNRTFAPHVLAVPTGSTVSFPNLDGIYHNVFSRSDSKSFDLGLYKSGQTRELVFDKEGIVRIGCNLHANMSAYVVVVSAPHYAITNGKGAFAFRSLEPGKYRLRVYSERRQQPYEQVVDLKPEKNTTNVVLTPDAPPGPGTDKFGAPRVASK